MDRGGAARLQGACLETALAIGLTLPRTVVGLGDVSPDAPPQGDSLWIPPVHNVCGRLQGREAGRGPTSWGHYSTIVRILQWGVALSRCMLPEEILAGGGLLVGASAHPRKRNVSAPWHPAYRPAGAAGLPARWGRMVLSWPAPSISGGSGLACAVVPPAHPPTFLETGGPPCTPGGGCAPCTLLGEMEGAPFLTFPRVGAPAF